MFFAGSLAETASVLPAGSPLLAERRLRPQAKPALDAKYDYALFAFYDAWNGHQTQLQHQAPSGSCDARNLVVLDCVYFLGKQDQERLQRSAARQCNCVLSSRKVAVRFLRDMGEVSR
ncbi:hypothetical protein LTR66_005997 [Elasticomyces elasticus]|nr:hypothetical protein LTR66_005997 [Elasticomyces elasticus]